jgi:1-hydroxycarotenoid 3,4-desaturase
VGRAGLGALARVDAHRTMARALAKAFASPHLRQLFGRYATYVGSSPFEAPATLNLIAHVEAEGVYRVRDGMGAVPKALEARARGLGVAIVRSADVERVVIESGRAAGVIAEGELVRADAVVFNGDVSALGAGLMGDGVRGAVAPTPRGARSLSAITWTALARARGAPLVHHNVFFADPHAYRAELEAVLVHRRVPDAPTVYVCAQDRGDAPLPDGHGEERLLVLVNAPATGDAPSHWTPWEIERCENAMSKSLERCGLTIEASAVSRTTPVDFHRRFPASGGALYGPIARGALSAFARASTTTRVPGLYLAGGSVHPGPGVPMAALSGRIAAARVLADLASTARSRTVGISGTTSMASATTASSPSS